MKIKGKITTAILASAIGLAVIIGGFSIFQSTTILESEINDKLTYLATSEAEKIETKLAEIESKADYVSSTILNSVNSQKIQQNKEYLLDYKQTTIDNLIKRTAQMKGMKGAYFYFNPKLINEAHDVWYANPKGEPDKYQKQAETGIDSYSKDNEDMSWYYQPIEKKKAVWSDPYESWSDDSIVVSYTKAVFKDGTLIGVLGMDFEFAKIKGPIEDIQVYNNGYGLLLNNNHDFLVHPQYKQEQNLGKVANGALKFITDQIKGQKTGTATYNLDNAGKEMGYAKLSNGWILGVTVPRSELFAQRNKLIFLLVGICLVGSLIIIAISYILGKRFSQPLEAAVEHCEQMAQGDFSQLMAEEYQEREDEIGDLAQGFNKINTSMQKMISEIKEFIENLSAQGEELSASAQEGNATIETTNDLISNMSASIQEISASAEEVASFAQEADSKAGMGQNNMEETLESMNQINETVEETVTVIEELDNTSEEIQDIVEMITDIAEQTNLLALNAAIEAARAGSNSGGGQGFAVVADEIRELAEETNEATDQISQLVQKTKTKSHAGLEAVREVKKKVEIGQDKVVNTNRIFNEIKESSSQSASQVEQTAQATQNLAESSDQVQEAAGEIEEMSREITSSSEELAEMSQKLQRLIEKFDI